MLFLGMANAYVMRTNMSVAIVAMVNHTALPVVEIETEIGNTVSTKTEKKNVFVNIQAIK